MEERTILFERNQPTHKLLKSLALRSPRQGGERAHLPKIASSSGSWAYQERLRHRVTVHAKSGPRACDPQISQARALPIWARNTSLAVRHGHTSAHVGEVVQVGAWGVPLELALPLLNLDDGHGVPLARSCNALCSFIDSMHQGVRARGMRAYKRHCKGQSFPVRDGMRGLCRTNDT